jgi:hypothetical protein
MTNPIPIPRRRWSVACSWAAMKSPPVNAWETSSHHWSSASRKTCPSPAAARGSTAQATGSTTA